MAESPKKASGYQAFADLTKKLLDVPRSELDKRMKAYDDAKSKRKKKRPKGGSG